MSKSVLNKNVGIDATKQPMFFGDDLQIQRYDTMKYCWDQVVKYNFKTIVELGTTRSFVDGKFPGT